MLKPMDVAERLNCSVQNVYSLIERGELEAFRIGAHGAGFRVSEEQLTSFLESRKERRHTEVPASPKKLNPIKLKHLK